MISDDKHVILPVWRNAHVTFYPITAALSSSVSVIAIRQFCITAIWVVIWCINLRIGGLFSDRIPQAFAVRANY